MKSYFKYFAVFALCAFSVLGILTFGFAIVYLFIVDGWDALRMTLFISRYTMLLIVLCTTGFIILSTVISVVIKRRKDNKDKE